MKRTLFLFLLVVFSGTAIAGAWTQQRGGGYYQLSFQYLSSGTYYDNNGDKIESEYVLTDYELSLYAEYGITDGLTAFISFPFYKSISLDENSSYPSESSFRLSGLENSGISDISAGIRFKLMQSGPLFLSGTVLAGLPAGDNDTSDILPLGDGELNVYAGLNAGYSLHPFPGWVNASAGYNIRNEGFSDQVIVRLEAGTSLAENRLLLMLKLSGVISLDNGDDTVKGGINKLFADNEQYLSVTPEVMYKISDNYGVNLSATTGGMTKNIISAIVYRAGFYYSM